MPTVCTNEERAGVGQVKALAAFAVMAIVQTRGPLAPQTFEALDGDVQDSNLIVATVEEDFGTALRDVVRM